MNIQFLNNVLNRLYRAEELAQSEEELIIISQKIEETRILIAECELGVLDGCMVD